MGVFLASMRKASEGEIRQTKWETLLKVILVDIIAHRVKTTPHRVRRKRERERESEREREREKDSYYISKA